MNEDKTTGKDMGTASSEPVSSSMQSPSKQGVFSMKKLPRSRKWLVIFVAAAVVVLGLVSAGIWWLSQYSATSDKKEASFNQPALATVCDKVTIQSTGKPISDNDIVSLQAVADGILQKKNYSGDVNCNYILMRYYLMMGDVSNAKRTIDDLTYTYGHYGGYSTAFDPPAMSPAALKDALDVMIANNNESQKQDDELNGLDP